MQTAEDRRRLLGHYAEEQSTLATVFRCAVGIATLFAVAAAPWLVLSTDRGSVTADAAQKAVATFPNSMEESRRVFEERERAQQTQVPSSKFQVQSSKAHPVNLEP